MASISGPLSRFLVLVFSTSALFVFYFGMRFSSLPAAYLSLALIPLGFLSVSLIRSPYKLSNNEVSILCLMLFLLLVTGVFIYGPHGLVFSPAAIAASLVVVCSYILARALVALDVAYFFSAISFWIVAIPALWLTISGAPFLLRDFFIGASENMVSSWLIMASAAMAAAKFHRSGRLSFVPFVITAVVSYFLYTRASVAIAFLSLLFVIYSRFGFGRVLVISIIAGSVVALNFNFFFGFLSGAIQGTKFGVGGLDSPRWLMWAAYWREINVVSFFIGMDVSSVPEIQEYSNNPHSSIIRFHSMFGVLPMFFMGTVALAVLWRGGAVYAFMFIAIFSRGVTDSLLFGIFFDAFLMIVLVCALKRHHLTFDEAGYKKSLKNSLTLR